MKQTATLSNLVFAPCFRFAYIAQGVSAELLREYALVVVYGAAMLVGSMARAAPSRQRRADRSGRAS